MFVACQLGTQQRLDGCKRRKTPVCQNTHTTPGRATGAHGHSKRPRARACAPIRETARAPRAPSLRLEWQISTDSRAATRPAENRLARRQIAQTRRLAPRAGAGARPHGFVKPLDYGPQLAGNTALLCALFGHVRVRSDSARRDRRSREGAQSERVRRPRRPADEIGAPGGADAGGAPAALEALRRGRLLRRRGRRPDPLARALERGDAAEAGGSPRRRSSSCSATRARACSPSRARARARAQRRRADEQFFFANLRDVADKCDHAATWRALGAPRALLAALPLVAAALEAKPELGP